MTTYTTTFSTKFSDDSSAEAVIATFEYCQDFTGDGLLDIRVTLDLTDANPPNSGTEDMIGIAFDIAGNAVAGLSVTDITRSTYFGSVSSFAPTVLISADGVTNATAGFNMSGGDVPTPFDISIKLSAEGAGEGIVQKVSFVISGTGDLDAPTLLNGGNWYFRFQSTDGGEESAKIGGGPGQLPPCDQPANPAIDVEKYIFSCFGHVFQWLDADTESDAVLVSNRQTVHQALTVENTGDVALTAVAVSDMIVSLKGPKANFTLVPGYDGNGDDVLDVGETWIFGARVHAGVNRTVGNEASAEAGHTDPGGTVNTVSDSDQAWFKAAGTGVGNTDFWKKNSAFWNGTEGDEGPKVGKAGYATGELAPGGTLDLDGHAIDVDYARAILRRSATQVEADARLGLMQEWVAAELNILAGNAAPSCLDDVEAALKPFLIERSSDAFEGFVLDTARQGPDSDFAADNADILACLAGYNAYGLDGDAWIAADRDCAYCPPDYGLLLAA